MNIENHPTVKRYRERRSQTVHGLPAKLDADWVKRVVLESGADDAGVAPVSSPILDKYRQNILTLFPEARTCISVVCRMNPVNVRSPWRQLYELEYHHMYAEADHVARRAAMKFLDHGIAAVDCCSSYPMNMENWPGNGMWWVAHKPVAEAAGRGRMGLNHLLVHKRYGSFIALATVLIDRDVTGYETPIDYEPCVNCMLCVTSCPVGALNADSHFNAVACVTHSYRLKYGGFTDWVENVVRSGSVAEYRRRVTDQETVLTWQALAVGTTYMCSNCMAVCPGGEDLIGPYVDDPESYRQNVAKRLQDKVETVYVVKGGDADGYVQKRFPHKKVKYVSNGVRAKTAAGFFDDLHILFQRERSKGLDATFHFTLTGEEPMERTVRVCNRTLEVLPGLQGTPGVRITADSRTWLRITAKERNPLAAMLAGRFRLSGSVRLFRSFVRCFPS